MRRTRLGYMVIETAEDYEQPLGLKTGEHLPPGGILEWMNGPRFVFLSRQDAWRAITRTEHYRLAFDPNAGNQIPERKFCKVIPVEQELK